MVQTTTGVEIITWLEGDSRVALHISARLRITAPIVLSTFRETTGQYGYPASILTDNGMVHTARFAGGHDAVKGRTSSGPRADVDVVGPCC